MVKERDYYEDPCKYLSYECINEDYDRDWVCKIGYGKSPMCDKCKDYERGKEDE